MSDFSELKRLAEAAVKEACAAKLGDFPCLPPCTSLSEFRAMASPEFILELLVGIGRAIEDRELFAKVARHQRARRSWWINNCCAAESRLHDVSAACATTEQERDHLKGENEILRRGMKGDYDLDAWLDWAKEAEALRSILRAFTGSAYPVSTEIDARGYRWSEAYLDEALAMSKEASNG